MLVTYFKRMIKLHLKKYHPTSERLKNRLDDLVITYRTEIHPPDTDGLPFIEENGEKIEGEQEIEGWLNELEAELSWQRSLSGDGCYINPKNGTVC